MKPFEETTHVFIIRVWWEPREGNDSKKVWRGIIEDVLTRERTFFRDLIKVTTFIEKQAGIPSADEDGLITRCEN